MISAALVSAGPAEGSGLLAHLLQPVSRGVDEPA